MAFLGDLLAGGVEGLLKGIGNFAIDIRTAITGEGPISGTDKAKLLEIAQELERLSIQSSAAQALAQIEVNKVEAQQGPFRGGWRPATGWVCVAGLFYTFLLRPLLPWTMDFFTTQPISMLPALDMGELISLLAGMLGLAGFRSYERVKGQA